MTKQVLSVIQDAIDSTRIEITEEEAVVLWPKAQRFVADHGTKPSIRSVDPLERRMAEALLFLQKKRREVGV